MGNKNCKTALGKIKSLMERMENNMTPNEAEMNQVLNEKAMIGPNEFFDALAQLNTDVPVTIGYVCGANLNLPIVKRRNPETNRMKGYNDYETFGRSLGIEKEIAGVVKLSVYSDFVVKSHDEVKKDRSDFARFEDELRIKYNMPPIARDSRKGKYITKQDYGKNGLTTYNGDDETKIGRTYNRQNIYGATVNSTYFLIGTDGNIIKELTKNDLTDYTKPYNVDGVNILRKLGREEEEIKQYIDDYNSKNMRFQSFINDRILFMVANSGDYGDFTYINDNFPNEIDGVKINPTEFIAKSKEYC